MSKQEANILQIRKYLNGELDAGAMHRLERQAQDDPFLMDALEGYQIAKHDQQANLDDLTARLNRRVSKTKRRIISFTTIGIAASVLIICSAGLWWFNRNNRSAEIPDKSQVANLVKAHVKPAATAAIEQPGKKKVIALQAAKPAFQTKAPLQKATGKTAHQLIAANTRIDTSLYVRKPVVFKPKVLGEVAVSKPGTGSKTLQIAEKDTTPLNEMIVMGYTTQKKKDTSGSILNSGYKNIKATANSSPVQLIQGRAAGVTIVQKAENNTQNNINGVALPPDVAAAANRLRAKRLINSEEIDQYQPLSVKAGGTNPAAIKGAKSGFALNNDSNKDRHAVADNGGRVARAGIAAVDSSKKNTPEPGSSNLSEVVVTGYTSQPKRVNQNIAKAHPAGGWRSFRKYLKINAVSPDGVSGVVKLTFMVDRYGSITNIKVIKGLSDAANKKAVRVIKDGPDWVGNSSKARQEVNLAIRFAK